MIVRLGIDLGNQLDLTLQFTNEGTEAPGSKVISQVPEAR